MKELNLEWIESGSLKTATIVPDQPSKQPGSVRIGRDPSRCDIVLSDGSVSGLHVEIAFEPRTQRFLLSNLRESNPPLVNGQPVFQGSVALLSENTIQLGNLQLRAIAVETFSPSQTVPQTELQNPQAFSSSPNESVSPKHFGSPPQPGVGAYESVPFSNQHQYLSNQPVPKTEPLHATPPSRRRWIFLGAGLFAIVLLGLTWPNLRSFLGIDTRPVSPSPSNPDGEDLDPLAMADLQPYQHPSELFSLDIPSQWEFLDNSQAGEVVIQGWRHPQLNAYVIVRIFEADSTLTRQEIQAFGTQLVQDLFGDLDGFQIEPPQPLLTQSVKVPWQAVDGSDTLLASTFVRQDGRNLSALSVWVPDRSGQGTDDLQQQIDEIVASFTVNSQVSIP